MGYKGKVINKFFVFFISFILLFSVPLGNSKLAYADDPVTDVVDISGGAGHTMVLMKDGTVWTWGKNYQGQLGDGTTTDSLTPVQVTGLTDVKEIAGGHNYSMALKSDGSVWTWGINNHRQFLGDGTTIERHTPVKVLTNVRHIAKTRYHAIALKNDGTVWTWGYNYSGQLGDGTKIDRLTPVKVTGLTDIKEIAAGSDHSMALKNDGTVWTWGDNSYGKLGDGTKVSTTEPVQVIGLSDVKAIAAGGNHSMALKDDGTVWTWGYNGQYQLGHSKSSPRLNSTPKEVIEISDVKEIAAGYNHSIALKDDGTVYTWGCNYKGQLGDGTTTCSISPLKILTDVKTIAAGYDHTMVVQNDGTVWAWGLNDYGQLGNQKKYSDFRPVKALGLDLPRPIKINVSYKGNLPNKTMQLYITAVLNDGSIIDITSDEDTTYEISNDAVATITDNGLVSVVTDADQDDFSITVYYKNFYAKTQSLHVRNTITEDKLIYKDTFKGTYYIFKKYQYSETISDSLTSAFTNILLGPLGSYGDVLRLINEVNKNSDIKLEDGQWQVKVPTYAIGDTFYLDGKSYSSYYWTSIEIVNKDKNRLINYLLACGDEIIYIVTNGDKFTIYVCDGVYVPKDILNEL